MKNTRVVSWAPGGLGLAERFLYGIYAGLVFCPIYNAINRRWGAQAHRPWPAGHASLGITWARRLSA